MLICFESDTVPVTEWGFNFFFRNSYTKIKVDSKNFVRFWQSRSNFSMLFIEGPFKMIHLRRQQFLGGGVKIGQILPAGVG